METRIGSPAEAGQTAANFNSLMMLRVKELATVELLTIQLPLVRIVSTIASSSVSDTNDPADIADFASCNEDRMTPERAAMQHGCPEFMFWVVNGVYGGIFEMTGLHRMGMAFANEAALAITDSVVRRAYVAGYDVIRVAMIGARLFGVRVAIILMLMPWILLLYALGLADGLVQRAIRQASGGRESSSLYHRAKYGWHACMVVLVLVVLLLPDLQPLTLLISLSALMGFMPVRV